MGSPIKRPYVKRQTTVIGKQFRNIFSLSYIITIPVMRDSCFAPVISLLYGLQI